jgi:DNA polymerase-3 subunit delta
MSERQVVVVKEAQAIRNMEELSYYLQKPLNSTILVLCHKHGVLDRRKKLAAEIEKVGVLFGEGCPVTGIHHFIHEAQRCRLGS